MDDSSKYYTIQIKGTAYRFAPIPTDDLERLIMVMNMNAGALKTVKAVTSALKAAAGAEQWDAITDRLISKELELTDVTSELLKKIMKRQGKDAPAPDDE